MLEYNCLQKLGGYEVYNVIAFVHSCFNCNSVLLGTDLSTGNVKREFKWISSKAQASPYLAG